MASNLVLLLFFLSLGISWAEEAQMAPGGNIHNGQFSVHFIFNNVLYDDVSLAWIAACTFSVPVTQMAVCSFSFVYFETTRYKIIKWEDWIYTPKTLNTIKRHFWNTQCETRCISTDTYCCLSVNSPFLCNNMSSSLVYYVSVS